MNLNDDPFRNPRTRFQRFCGFLYRWTDVFEFVFLLPFRLLAKLWS